ncbi:hypothetical protein MBCUT_10250 [Methanobrevibacter cuticularis]|uniref:Uncharacterized protein n=1 Tax=Methanobrevibacter cuticularis TaxID=47311 RepID=A0A166E104_9EURY|nr:hypothetical protein [Methanobrevibacter cuticularis]KZX16159.1 hypothetical protein MBCUT_10250 [Methanobrevibacter cuticularis]
MNLKKIYLLIIVVLIAMSIVCVNGNITNSSNIIERSPDIFENIETVYDPYLFISHHDLDTFGLFDHGFNDTDKYNYYILSGAVEEKADSSVKIYSRDSDIEVIDIENVSDEAVNLYRFNITLKIPKSINTTNLVIFVKDKNEKVLNAHTLVLVEYNTSKKLFGYCGSESCAVEDPQEYCSKCVGEYCFDITEECDCGPYYYDYPHYDYEEDEISEFKSWQEAGSSQFGEILPKLILYKSLLLGNDSKDKKLYKLQTIAF